MQMQPQLQPQAQQGAMVPVVVMENGGMRVVGYTPMNNMQPVVAQYPIHSSQSNAPQYQQQRQQQEEAERKKKQDDGFDCGNWDCDCGDCDTYLLLLPVTVSVLVGIPRTLYTVLYYFSSVV